MNTRLQLPSIIMENMKTATNKWYLILTKHRHIELFRKTSLIKGKIMFQNSMECKQSKSTQLSWTRVFIWTLQDWGWHRAILTLKVDSIKLPSRTRTTKVDSTNWRITDRNIQIALRSKHSDPCNPRPRTPTPKLRTTWEIITTSSSTWRKGKSHPRSSSWGTLRRVVSRCTWSWSPRTIGSKSFP